MRCSMREFIGWNGTRSRYADRSEEKLGPATDEYQTKAELRATVSSFIAQFRISHLREVMLCYNGSKPISQLSHCTLSSSLRLLHAAKRPS